MRHDPDRSRACQVVIASPGQGRPLGGQTSERFNRPSRALTLWPVSITFLKMVLPEHSIMTTITVKGQVTLPKEVREAVGLKPGDKVEVRATASGGVYIEKPGAGRSYRERLEALRKRRLIRGMTTDEFMEFSRGESPEHRPK